MYRASNETSISKIIQQQQTELGIPDKNMRKIAFMADLADLLNV